MCIVSPGAIFIESAIPIESARALSAAAAALRLSAFLHAPAAMTTSAMTNAMRFMLSPVEGSEGTAKRTWGTYPVKQR